MKVALIGASGFVGAHVLQELLNRGHQVTAIVRNPARITVEHPNLVVKKGDVYNREEVAALVKDACDHVAPPSESKPNKHHAFA